MGVKGLNLGVVFLVLNSFAFAAEEKNQLKVIGPTPSQGEVGTEVVFECKNFPTDKLSFEFTGASTKDFAFTQDLEGNYRIRLRVPNGTETGPVKVRILEEKKSDGPQGSTKEKNPFVPAGSFTILSKAKPKTEDSSTTPDGAVGRGRGTQTLPQGPPQGGGTSTPTPPNFAADMDLPIEKPIFGTIQKGKTPPPPPPSPPPIHQGDDRPPTFYGQEVKSENHTIFYVLDISGSMGWDSTQYTKPDGTTALGDRLDHAKAALVKSIMSLPENFKFNILSYDCGIYPWQAGLQQADAAHKAAAIAWVNQQEPQGGTGTGPAVSIALHTPDVKLVLLLTDGAPNCGASGDPNNSMYGEQTIDAHRQMIRINNVHGAQINVYGIMCSGQFRNFCIGVACDNNGAYTDVR